MLRRLQRLFNYPYALKVFVMESFLLSFRNEIFLKFGIYKPVKQLHFNSEETDDKLVNAAQFSMLKYASKSSKLLEKYAPWKPMCYNRALTIKQLLLRRKIQTDLHIGFRKKDGAFDGHAWITYKGKVVTGFLPKLHTFSQFDFTNKNLIKID